MGKSHIGYNEGAGVSRKPNSPGGGLLYSVGTACRWSFQILV